VEARATIDVEVRRLARCSDGRGSFNQLFFSDDPLDIARAKAICSRCVMRESCLAGALARGEVWGVWGGEILVDGEIVAEKRRRGRPPKEPRPVLVVDEVPDRPRGHVA
jgi:WhiB family redox-sensing transcriptional regulator